VTTDDLLWLLLAAMPAVAGVLVGVVFLGLAVWITDAVVRGEQPVERAAAPGRDKALGIVLVACLVDFAFVIAFAALFPASPPPDPGDDPEEPLPALAKYVLPRGEPHAKAAGLLRFGLCTAVMAMLLKLLLPATFFRAVLIALWYETVWLAIPMVVLFALEGPGILAKWL
jgi:hypothetical protein